MITRYATREHWWEKGEDGGRKNVQCVASRKHDLRQRSLQHKGTGFNLSRGHMTFLDACSNIILPDILYTDGESIICAGCLH